MRSRNGYGDWEYNSPYFPKSKIQMRNMTMVTLNEIFIFHINFTCNITFPPCNTSHAKTVPYNSIRYHYPFRILKIWIC